MTTDMRFIQILIFYDTIYCFILFQHDDILFHLVGGEKTMQWYMKNNMFLVEILYLVSIISTNQTKITHTQSLDPQHPFLGLSHIRGTRDTVLQCFYGFNPGRNLFFFDIALHLISRTRHFPFIKNNDDLLWFFGIFHFLRNHGWFDWGGRNAYIHGNSTISDPLGWVFITDMMW